MSKTLYGIERNTIRKEEEKKTRHFRKTVREIVILYGDTTSWGREQNVSFGEVWVSSLAKLLRYRPIE